MGRGRPEGSVEPIDLREVLSLCVSEQHTEAEKKGLSFSFDFDENPVILAIREQDAQRLFGNLISNAVRYASKEIRLSCHSSGESAIIRVADDGPGIAEEDLPHVFERFYKGSRLLADTVLSALPRSACPCSFSALPLSRAFAPM